MFRKPGLFERQIQYEVPFYRVGFPRKYVFNIQKTWGHWSYKIILDTIQDLRKLSQGGQTVNRKSMIDSFRSVKK